jgi:SSS family solute:Na+ symporter
VNISIIKKRILFFWLSIFSSLILSAADGDLRSSKEEIHRWAAIGELPGIVVKNGSFSGESNGALILAGGSDEEGIHSSITVLVKNDEAQYTVISGFELNNPLAFGAAASFEEGLLCIGGRDNEQSYAEVFLLKWDPTNRKIEKKVYPNLPEPRSYSAAAIIDGVVYVAGGIDTRNSPQSSKNFWSLDLKLPDKQWEVLEEWPGPSRMLAVATVQHDGFYNILHLTSGLEISTAGNQSSVIKELNDGYRYNPIAENISRWDIITDPPRPIFGAKGTGVGQSHILFYGGYESERDFFLNSLSPEINSFHSAILAYHTFTNTWVKMGELPNDISSAEVILGKEDILLLGTSDSAEKFYAGKPILKKSGFSTIDYTLLGAYLLALVVLGIYFSKREKSTEDYFLGGRRVPWWAVGLSIIGTGLSAATYISTPAKVYATDWAYFLLRMPAPIVVIIQMYLLLPFFRRLYVTTTYEYLEMRFNLLLRLFGSLSFIIAQLGRMGIVLYLPAIALSAATGLNVYFCIISMGVLCTIYTVLGGIEAVIWTDVLQVIVFYTGAVIILFIAIFRLDGGIIQFFEICSTHDNFNWVNKGWDIRTTSLFVIIVMSFQAVIVPNAGDQVEVQRWLTTKDEKSARKALAVGAIISIPASFLFFYIGSSMFAYYQNRPEELNPVLMTDGIIPWFVVQNLPVGISGFVIAAIFSASMSSMDSTMNSLATSIVTDCRRLKKTITDHQGLNLARWLTVLFGIFGTVMALIFATIDIPSLIDLMSIYNGLFMGALIGVFWLGMFTNRANALGTSIGIIVSAVVMYCTQKYTPLHFFIYMLVSSGTCIIVGYLASIVTGGNKNLPEGFTIFTLPKEIKD